jgi:peptide/nickel transport system substrate-binding protein
MNNRFTIKDALGLLLLVVIIVMLGLKMLQDDRQWERLTRIEQQVDSQTRDMAELRRLLRSGVTVNAGDGTTPNHGSATTDATGPFARALEARENEDFATGDWLVDSFGSQINTLTPLVSSDANASTVQGQVLESLGALDEQTLEIKPLLAKSWTIDDNTEAYHAFVERITPRLEEQASEDPSVYADQLEAMLAAGGEQIETGSALYAAIAAQAKANWIEARIEAHPDRPTPLTIRFTLRPGLNFSDGEPLTTDDVVFSFNWLMNEKVAAPRARAYFRMIEAVEALDARTVEFRFRKPYFEALQLAASMDVLPEHFYAPRFAEAPEKFNRSKGVLVGSGRFMLEDPEGWSPSNQIVLLRNDRYWGVPAAFDRLVFRLYTQDTARLTAFRNREIDLFAASPEQYVEMLEDEALMNRVDSYEYMTPYNGYRYVAWNQQDAEGGASMFADRRVRQALTMLVDRQRMIDEVMLGYGQIADGPFNPLGEQGSPTVDPWPHDIEGAKSLLAEAGYTDRDGDGVIEDETGAALRFKLTYPSGHAFYRKLIAFLKDAYAKAGVVLEPDPIEWSVMVERLNNKSFEAICLGWTSGPESDIYQMFHSSQTLPGGDNFVHYRSEELDRLIERARQTIDPDQRMKLWREAHAVLHRDQPYTFLAWGKSLRFLDQRFKNVHLLKAGLNPRAEWYVPEPRQRWTK